MNERHIDINEFDYDLPDGRIAKFPLAERSASKLLVYRGGEIGEAHFADIGDVLPEGQLLVFNNTKVIRARIIMHKPSGARIEVFCLEPHDPADYERAFAVVGRCEWSCIVGNLKKWKEGYVEINFEHEGRPEHLRAWLVENRGREHTVRFEWSAAMTFGQLLEYLGRIPIPPYLNRESEEIDYTRYQTVYSKFEGSVAAPTAGLHFTPELIEGMKARGFGFEEVTLHVGAGTLLPVKDDDAARHPMHTEHFEVRRAAVARLLEKWGRITAVGTTSVRTLESLTALAWRIRTAGTPDAERVVGQWELYDVPAEFSGREALETLLKYMDEKGLERIKAATQIMITPLGYEFPHRAQYRHQLPPAQIDAAATGVGFRRRGLEADLRIRPRTRLPFPELRRLVGADALTLGARLREKARLPDAAAGRSSAVIRRSFGGGGKSPGSPGRRSRAQQRFADASQGFGDLRFDGLDRNPHLVGDRGVGKPLFAAFAEYFAAAVGQLRDGFGDQQHHFVGFELQCFRVREERLRSLDGDAVGAFVAKPVERAVAHGAEQIGPDGSRDAEFPGMLPDVRKGVQYDLFGRGAVTEPVGREPAKRGVITVEQLPKGGGSPPLG